MPDDCKPPGPGDLLQAPEMAIGLLYAATGDAYCRSVKNQDTEQASFEKINEQMTTTIVDILKSLSP